MVSAINVGILQSIGDLTSVLSSGCSSGSCTFSDDGTPSFSTLAVSHICEDSTARIRVFNESKTSEAPYDDILELKYGSNNRSFQWTRQSHATVVQSWTDRTQPGIMGIYFLFRPDFENEPWTVVNCSLFPTIDTYSVSIQNATLKEVRVDTTYLPSLGEQFENPNVTDGNFNNLGFMYSHRAVSVYTMRNGTKVACESSDIKGPGLVIALESSDDPTYVNLTGHTNPSAGWKWSYYPDDCVWTIVRFCISSMQDTLNGVFQDQNVSMGLNRGLFGSPHLSVLFSNGNMNFDSVNQSFNNLATSMSTIFRTHGGLVNTTAFVEKPSGLDQATTPLAISERGFGTVWVNTTCVYIRWKWIAFPAVMIGLAGVFLMLVALENRGTETDRLWKSSFLATLFCEVEMNEEVSGREEMRAVAKTTSVSLQKDTSRLRLVKE